MSGLSYALVTPARNEADNLRRLAGCLAAQTRQPSRWVIVDNGSTDSTLAVAWEFERTLPWVRVHEAPGADALDRGAPVVRAFQAGLNALRARYDVVVKLDADVSMEPEYFERLLAAFEGDPTLGIASGSAFEEGPDGVWRQQYATGGSAWGASRAYRWECLEDVLPLEEYMGWDGIDRLKANMRGWRTGTLVSLPFQHHRKEGERDGARRKAWAAQGDCAHYMGYRLWYLVLRALHNARREPAALAMIAGHVSAAVRRKPRCPDPAVRAYLRSEQRLGNLLQRRREALGKTAGLT
jgi:glycosyltransferase involved in cell wall biosynthesis